MFYVFKLFKSKCEKNTFEIYYMYLGYENQWRLNVLYFWAVYTEHSMMNKIMGLILRDDELNWNAYTSGLRSWLN